METFKEPQKAVSQLVRTYAIALYRYAVVRVSDPECARDLVQETFLAALQKIKDVRFDNGEKNWLYSILKNKIIDYYRSHSGSKTESFNEEYTIDHLFNESGMWKKRVTAWENNPEESFSDHEFMITLRKCVSTLPLTHQKAFSLRDIEGFENEDISSVLGVTAANLWTIMSRARQKLRECLTANWFGGIR